MPTFPFNALVGQESLKRALLLGIIQPRLGGVLIRGTKGVAKSTAVRALASLLPPLETVLGCPFQRAPGEVLPAWPLPADAPVGTRPVRLVELPLGATEDRVLGSLHLENALRGERAFEPGLLAAANRGILYIDEVNLLPDHLVDILLDAAASGVHRVEREGLSLSHPARFVLIGTMNPEEGELRPQLLDRFGLVVDVQDLTDPAERAEAVRRRMAFEADPEGFCAIWSADDAAEAQRIVQAQELLPRVSIPDSLLRAISERCLAAGVEGLRADLTLGQAACAWAAYQGRREVEPADIEAVAELALAHRRTRPQPPPSGGERNGPPPPAATPSEKRSQTAPQFQGGSASHATAGSPSPDQVFVHAGLFAAIPRPSVRLLTPAAPAGRWRARTASRQGYSREIRLQRFDSTSRLAWSATLRAAALFQQERGRREPDGPLRLHAADVRLRRPRGPAGCLLLFVVDASGSMAAWQRMRRTKSAILALLLQAHQRRDRIALLAFRGENTELILPPAQGLQTAIHALERLPVGGTTPLAGGLSAAGRLIRRQLRRHPRQPIWTVLLTDGRANVATTGGDPWPDALRQARFLAALDAECLVVDTETGWPRFGRARDLAQALGGACLPLEEVLGRPLPFRLARVEGAA